MAKPAEDYHTLHELVRQARVNLNQNAWDYLIGGAETETTQKRNRLALDSLAFRPRVLRDVTRIDCSAELLGQTLRLPLLLAPIGSLESFGDGGGATAARAAARYDIAHMLSSVCWPGLEDVAEAAGSGLRLYQLYVRGDGAWLDDHAQRAADYGYCGFCLTVDTAHYSRRERDIAKRYVKPWRARDRIRGSEYQQALSWDDVKRYKDRHSLPLLLKGIATAEDAKLACEHGVDGVYVSNHGGRQLDHGRGAIEVLPEVVEAVAGRIPVIVDGGFMRGSDVVKAMILGADIVGLGRLQCLAMAAAGSEGIVRGLELLEDEIRVCLGLLGVTCWSDLDSSYIHTAAPVAPPKALSAMPLLEEPY